MSTPAEVDPRPRHLAPRPAGRSLAQFLRQRDPFSFAGTSALNQLWSTGRTRKARSVLRRNFVLLSLPVWDAFARAALLGRRWETSCHNTALYRFSLFSNIHRDKANKVPRMARVLSRYFFSADRNWQPLASPRMARPETNSLTNMRRSTSCGAVSAQYTMPPKRASPRNFCGVVRCFCNSDGG